MTAESVCLVRASPQTPIQKPVTTHGANPKLPHATQSAARDCVQRSPSSDFIITSKNYSSWHFRRSREPLSSCQIESKMSCLRNDPLFRYCMDPGTSEPASAVQPTTAYIGHVKSASIIFCTISIDNRFQITFLCIVFYLDQANGYTLSYAL